MIPATPARRHPHGSLIVLTVLALLWAGWALWYSTAPDTNTGGQCEGLGFGCTPTPRDVATFVGLIGLAPASALVLLVTLLVRVLRVGRGSPRTAWDLVVGGLLLSAGLLWVVGAVAGAF